MFLKRKPSKAGRGLSPAQHQCTGMKPCKFCSSPPSLLYEDSPAHQTPEVSSCSSARSSVLDLLGADDEQALAAGCVGAKLHPFSTRRARLQPFKRRCAHTLTRVSHPPLILSGLTPTFLLETMCSPEACRWDVWLLPNTSLLNAFPALQRNISPPCSGILHFL